MVERPYVRARVGNFFKKGTNGKSFILSIAGLMALSQLVLFAVVAQRQMWTM